MLHLMPLNYLRAVGRSGWEELPRCGILGLPARTSLWVCHITWHHCWLWV